MRYTLIFLLLLSIFSCSKKEDITPSNILENLSLTIDTVLIDSKGKLFDLRRGPHSSSISEDGKHLFLFNSNSNQIQKINLDELTWEQDYDFEVEGPNGTSDLVLKTKTIGSDKFLITAFNHMGIYDKAGSRLKDLSISSLPISTNLDELNYGILLSEDQKSLFSLPGIQYNGPRTLAKINLENYEVENFKLPEMDWIYDIKVSMGERVVLQETMYLVEINNQILALSRSASAFYSYDSSTDSLSYHTFEHQISPTKIDVVLKAQVNSDKEYQDEFYRFFMAFLFEPPIWDASRELYFRFGRKPTLRDENYQLIKSEVYLYAYDQEFNLIGEALLPITNRPSDPFLKDGKLWSYVNVEDELGFAVMDFKF